MTESVVPTGEIQGILRTPATKANDFGYSAPTSARTGHMTAVWPEVAKCWPSLKMLMCLGIPDTIRRVMQALLPRRA